MRFHFFIFAILCVIEIPQGLFGRCCRGGSHNAASCRDRRAGIHLDGENGPSLGHRPERRDPERRSQPSVGAPMSVLDALAADRAGEIEAAAARYENVLVAGERSLQILLNLALLYWQATDVGLAASNKLSPDFLATADRRFPCLLEEAQRLFPESTEPRFWKRYIAWADLGEPLDSDECRELLREDPAVLAPAIHILRLQPGE